MKIYLSILLAAMLTNNFVLSKFLGICAFLGVSKKTDTALGMSLAVMFVTLMATAVTWPIYQYILVKNNIEYLETLVFILVIAALVQLVEIALKKYIPGLYRSFGIYLPLITTNCVILGVVVLNISEAYTFGQSMMNSLGGSLGYMIAMIMFSGVRGRLEGNDIPKSLRGLPSTLIAASIVACSFLGFSGIVDGIFA